MQPPQPILYPQALRALVLRQMEKREHSKVVGIYLDPRSYAQLVHSSDLPTSHQLLSTGKFDGAPVFIVSSPGGGGGTLHVHIATAP